MRNIQSHLMVALGFVIVLALVSCRNEAEPVDAPSPIMGNWEGDAQTQMEMYPKLSELPTAEIFFAMLEGLSVEFGEEKYSLRALGTETSFGYRIVSESESLLIIEATEGETIGEQTHIEILPDDRLKVFQEGTEKIPLIVKRAGR